MTRSYALGLALICAAVVLTAADPPVTFGFELHKNVVFVKASIGDSQPLDMALDSGSGHTSLDEAVARKLGLDLSLKALSSGARGKQEISAIKNVTLRFAGLDVAEPLIVAYPLDFLSEVLGRRVDGIIGIELFHKYVVEMDYPAQRLRVLFPDTFAYAGPGEAIPVTYNGRMPIVAGSFTPYGRESIPARLQVDTGGARAGAMMWKAFDEKHGLLAGARDLTEVPVTGFGGTTRQKLGRIQAMQIGNITVAEPLVGLIDYNLGDPNIFDGNLGSGFLKDFKVVFDLPHDRLILERPAAQ